MATSRGNEKSLQPPMIVEVPEIARRTYANCEVARARADVSMLPALANGAGKSGPAPPLQKQIERLNRLPKALQNVVIQILDGVLSQARR